MAAIVVIAATIVSVVATNLKHFAAESVERFGFESGRWARRPWSWVAGRRRLVLPGCSMTRRLLRSWLQSWGSASLHLRHSSDRLPAASRSCP